MRVSFSGACPEAPVALQAILFVRDLDTSLLGQNELGLENFDHLRKCTDELVNAILHVRQLLKRRRQSSGADGKQHTYICCSFDYSKLRA